MRSADFTDLPTTWRASPLKYLVSTAGGMTPSKDRPDFWDGTVPWVSPKDMKRPVLDDSIDHVSDLALSATGLRLHPVDSVLVVIRGMILAHTFPVARNAVPVTVNQDMKALTARAGVNPRFLSWLLTGLEPLMLAMTDESAHGTKALRTDQWENASVPMPPPDVQERIANFLDEQTARIDALIAEKERLLAKSKEYFASRLGTAVVQGIVSGIGLVHAPEKGFAAVRADWALVPLKHLVSVSGGMTPSKDNESFWQGDIPWVSPKDMKRFVLHDSEDHISAGALASTSLKLQPADSVLVVVRGMILAHTFPVAINAVPVTVNQDMKALWALGRILPRYLAWMLRGLQPLMLSLTDESAHGTKALRTDLWANQCVPLPPPHEQRDLVSAFEAWEVQASDLDSHLKLHIGRLQEYRASLISAAVTGQLDISTFTPAEAE